MRKFIKYLPLLLLISLCLVGTLWGVQNYLNFDQLKQHHKALELFIVKREFLALTIYALVYIIITGASIPGASFLTVTGGFLFGQWLGTFIVVISATIGATIILLSTKLASKDVLRKKAGSWLNKMQAGFEVNQVSYLLTLRLIPLFPFVAVNLVCGLLQVNLRTFVWTTFLGIIPGSFVYVSLGVALQEVINQPNFEASLIINPKILIALVGLGILTLLPVIYKKLHKSD